MEGMPLEKQPLFPYSPFPGGVFPQEDRSFSPRRIGEFPMQIKLRKARYRIALVTAAVLLLVLVAQPAPAALVKWDGPTTNNLWTNKFNWDTDTVPVLGDDVEVISGTSQTVSFNTNILAPGLNSLKISGSGGATVTFTQSLKTLTAKDLTVGFGNGTGIHNQSLGTTTVTNLFVLGNNVNSVGIYNKSGGSFSAGRMLVGRSGVGTFNNSSSSLTVTGTDLILGFNTSGNGTYNMSSGSLSVKRDEYVGDEGTGSFSQSSGTHTIGRDLYVGDDATATGTFKMSAGSLTVNRNEVIGNYGIGTFIQSSGTHTVKGEFDVGNNTGGVGIFTMTSGSLNVAKNAYIGSQDATGTFTQTSGSVTIGGDFILGRSGAGSQGTYKMTSGSLTVKGPNGEVIGQDGTGVFTQTSGSNTVTSGPLILAKNAGSFGTYNLNSGSVTAPTIQINGSTTPAPTGTGKFNVTGTATVNGNVTNDGEVKTTNANVTWNGTFTNNNSYISDPGSTQTFNKDLVVSGTGYLKATAPLSATGASQDVFIFKESFQVTRTGDPNQMNNWDTANAAIKFVTGGDNVHDLYIPSTDIGRYPPPGLLYSWHSLDITGQVINLKDGAPGDPAAPAFYTGELLGVVLNGLNQVTNIIGGPDAAHPLYIYFDDDLPANAYLGHNDYLFATGYGGIYWDPTDSSGPQAMAQTPVPPSLFLLGTGLLGLGALGWRRRKKR